MVEMIVNVPGNRFSIPYGASSGKAQRIPLSSFTLRIFKPEFINALSTSDMSIYGLYFSLTPAVLRLLIIAHRLRQLQHIPLKIISFDCYLAIFKTHHFGNKRMIIP